MRIVIVGGVAAGASAAARLRRLNENDEIIIIEKGKHISFSNCGLPYRLSSTIPYTSDLILMTPEKLNAQYNIDVRVNSEVTAVLEKEKMVTIKTTEKEYNLSYDKLVLTPGSQAIVPPITGLQKMKHFTLKTVSDVEDIIESLNDDIKNISVVGGGFIGVEAAENLKLAGYNVTLIEGGTQLLKPFDYEMSLYADMELRKNGVELIKNNPVFEVTEKEVILNDKTIVKTDILILAIGVKPSTAFLNNSNISLDKNGFIEVNQNYQTSDASVYAGGDAIKVENSLLKEKMPIGLAGPANKQGRLIADHINGLRIINNGYIASSIIKIFDLTLANTGLNEKQIKEKGINYNYAYAAPSDKVSIMPDVSPIAIKLLFESKTGKILGGQAISYGAADKRIDVLATAIKANMNVFELADLELTYAPPFGTGKDAINKIGYIASNLTLNLFDQISFTDVYNLVKTNAQIIDVRTKKEYEQSHIKAAKNIPMEEIRCRLDEIDKTKPVYVHCHTGQRSYNVALMLKSNGFEAYNIAGSFYFLKNYEQGCQKDNKNRENILK